MKKTKTYLTALFVTSLISVPTFGKPTNKKDIQNNIAIAKESLLNDQDDKTISGKVFQKLFRGRYFIKISENKIVDGLFFQEGNYHFHRMEFVTIPENSLVKINTRTRVFTIDKVEKVELKNGTVDSIELLPSIQKRIDGLPEDL